MRYPKLRALKSKVQVPVIYDPKAHRNQHFAQDISSQQPWALEKEIIMNLFWDLYWISLDWKSIFFKYKISYIFFLLFLLTIHKLYHFCLA